MHPRARYIRSKQWEIVTWQQQVRILCSHPRLISYVYLTSDLLQLQPDIIGLPKPQPDHFVRMARFAREIMESMSEITRSLELVLGPDTGMSSFALLTS